MADDKTESGLENTGTPAPPTPVISGNSNDKPTSPAPTFDIDSLTTKIAEKLNLDEVIERKLQSTKDKRFRQLEALTGDFQTMSNYLKAANGDPEIAARNYRLDQILSSDTVPQPGNGTLRPVGQERMTVEEVTAILTDESLSTDDPDVKKWGENSYATKDSAENALRRVAAKKRKQATAGTGAPMIEGQSHLPAPKDKEQQLGEAYTELDTLNNEPTKNAKKIVAVKDRIKALGGQI